MTQVVVVKGWEGFADRLEVLSHCIHYCQKHSASICVDWRDYMWGQDDKDFSDYFEIVGIPVLQISEVVDLMKKGAKVSPPAWTPAYMEAVPNQVTGFQEFRTQINLDYRKVDADIVVNNCRGDRTWHIENLTQNIRMKPAVIEYMKNALKDVGFPYTVAHLRGTDRLSTDLDDYLDDIKEKFDALPKHAKSRVYMISDMSELRNKWLEQVPNTQILEYDPCIFKLECGKQATHMIIKEVLEFYGVTKHELNLNTLRDFLLLSFSSWGVGNTTSKFTNLAGKFRHWGPTTISMWLGGYMPQSMALPKG